MRHSDHRLSCWRCPQDHKSASHNGAGGTPQPTKCATAICGTRGCCPCVHRWASGGCSRVVSTCDCVDFSSEASWVCSFCLVVRVHGLLLLPTCTIPHCCLLNLSAWEACRALCPTATFFHNSSPHNPPSSLSPHRYIPKHKSHVGGPRDM